MRFWIDMSTPKEVLFFKGLIKELEARDHDVTVTTRTYSETNDLINYFGIDAEIIGAHGKTRQGKLLEGILRIQELYWRFKNEDVHKVITLANPEVCRVAFGFGFPLANFIDIPEAQIVCRLTLPLSTEIFIPFHVSPGEIAKYWPGDPFVYDALDPVAWMPKEPAAEAELGLQEKYLEDGQIRHPLIVYREAETKATYYTGHEDFTHLVVKHLKKLRPDALFYEVPRYKRHRMVDLQSLLYYADLFLGGGGTTNVEACYWGTWTISCRPFVTSYDIWLENTGNMLRARSPDEAIKHALEMLDHGGKNPKHGVIQDQIFPLDAICDKLEDAL